MFTVTQRVSKNKAEHLTRGVYLNETGQSQGLDPVELHMTAEETKSKF